MRKTSLRTLTLLIVAIVIVSGAPAASGGRPRIKVLTFNVWGVVYDAKYRSVRMRAMGAQIARLSPDVVVFQEVFEPHHRKLLLKSLKKNGYPVEHWKYFRRMYGSGLLLVSRFPIIETTWDHYVANGGYHDIEWLGGKGVGHVVLDTPWGPLDFFLTHAIAQLNASYDENGMYIGGDLKITDRLLQMYQLDRVVRSRRAKSARPVIVAGDFNVSPDMLEYKFLMAITGFRNSFDVVHPGEDASTYSSNNVYTGKNAGRIDHIFYKNYDGSTGFWLKPVVSRVEMKQLFKSPKTEKMLNYSDHYGLWTEFGAITDRGFAEISTDGLGAVSPSLMGELNLSGYVGGKITLNGGNKASWRDMALNIFDKAYKKRQRANRLLVPMAQAIVQSQSTGPSTVIIPPADRLKFEKTLSATGRK